MWFMQALHRLFGGAPQQDNKDFPSSSSTELTPVVTQLRAEKIFGVPEVHVLADDSESDDSGITELYIHFKLQINPGHTVPDGLRAWCELGELPVLACAITVSADAVEVTVPLPDVIDLQQHVLVRLKLIGPSELLEEKKIRIKSERQSA